MTRRYGDAEEGQSRERKVEKRKRAKKEKQGAHPIARDIVSTDHKDASVAANCKVGAPVVDGDAVDLHEGEQDRRGLGEEGRKLTCSARGML